MNLVIVIMSLPFFLPFVFSFLLQLISNQCILFYRFRVRFTQFNQTIADMALLEVSPDTLKQIEDLNSLDVDLYEYAKELLKQRYRKLMSQDKYYKEHFDNMGRSKFSWSDIEQA